MTAASIDAGIVGTSAGPRAQTIDARWLMAYAAALGESDARCYDTLSPEGPLAHPLFPVAYEWPLAAAVREKTIGEALLPRGVHVTHELVLHRLPRAGDRLLTTARVLSVARHRSGALVVLALDTVDASGAAVSSTRYGSLYRGVAVAGHTPDGEPPPPSGADAGAVRWEERVDVPATAAHVYTEGARIWNPIHTDVAAARAAGLPGPILHGTATLALAVSRVLARDVPGGPRRVRRIAARFTGVVPLPSAFTVRGRAQAGAAIHFDAAGDGGRPILSQGVLEA